MKTYEYIRLAFDYGDLGSMNRLSSTGWRVVAVTDWMYSHFALMERELPARAEASWDRNYCPVCEAFLAEGGPHKPMCELAAKIEKEKASRFNQGENI